MKFSRTSLLAAVEAAIKAHEAAHLDDVRRWDEAMAARISDWVDEYGPAWIEASQRIAKLIRNGQPVTSGDLPGRGHVETYSEPWRSIGGLAKPGRYLGAPALVSLRTMLQAITDDEVNVTSLRQMGVTAATMRAAMDQLGRINAASAA